MILYAINISSGGGKVLLDEVLLKQPLGKADTLFLDARYDLPPEYNSTDIIIVRVAPNLPSRWMCEYKLRQFARKFPTEQVICFGNLPPAFKLASKTVLYLQNAFLLSTTPLPKDSFKLFMRTLYEKLWFKLFIRNVDEIWVQTQWMKKNLSKNLKSKTLLKPIFPTLPQTKEIQQKNIDFIAITGTINYKNLIPLLEGIKEAKITDKNFVIVSDGSNHKIETLLNELKNLNINLKYLTNLSRSEIFDLCSKSKCLILTSQLESFCLPLHEALHFKMGIISGEFDFVTEYTKPTMVLKEISSNEISKALLLYSSPST